MRNKIPHKCEDCKFYSPTHTNPYIGVQPPRCLYRFANEFNGLPQLIGSLDDNSHGTCRNFYQKVIKPIITKKSWLKIF
jgi:hypothetical protein